MHGNKDAIWMMKNCGTIKFDIVIPTANGALYCAYLKRQVDVTNIIKSEIALTINQAHMPLGHMNEERTRLTAKH